LVISGGARDPFFSSFPPQQKTRSFSSPLPNRNPSPPFFFSLPIVRTNGEQRGFPALFPPKEADLMRFHAQPFFFLLFLFLDEASYAEPEDFPLPFFFPEKNWTTPLPLFKLVNGRRYTDFFPFFSPPSPSKKTPPPSGTGRHPPPPFFPLSPKRRILDLPPGQRVGLFPLPPPSPP